MPDSDLSMSDHATNRRVFIGRVALVIGLATVVGGEMIPRVATAAPAKLPQGEIGYQPTPKGKARCELCLNWQAPNTCKLVAGAISPTGWCGLFAPRS